MKAWTINALGEPDLLELSDMPVPEPGPGQVRMKVAAISLNPADYMILSRGLPSWTFPKVIGLDSAGVVDKVGSGVTGWSAGMRACYHSSFTDLGAFSQYILCDTRSIAAIPDSLSFRDAAAIPTAGWTAFLTLCLRLRRKHGDTILVHAGAGGVGSFAIQIAKWQGLKVITTCSTENTDYVRSLGASAVIDYRHEDVVSRVKDFTNGRGLDAILDSVGSASVTAGLSLLAHGGAIACLAGVPPIPDPTVIRRGTSILDIGLGMAYLSNDDQAIRELGHIGREFSSLVEDGHIDPIETEAISFNEIPFGLARLRDRHVRGKLVADVPQ
jgi:NADPH:quinone reductase